MAPPLKGEKVIEAIASAHESTIRSVLRALCADKETEHRIGALLSKLLPDTTNPSSGSFNSANKRKPGGKMEICVQCDQPFDEEGESETCVYHPGEWALSTILFPSFFRPPYYSKVGLL